MEIDEDALEIARKVDLGEMVAPSTRNRKRHAGGAMTRSQAKVI
jgi:hypothetical protein